MVFVFLYNLNIMKPLMKTWKIIVNVILAAFGILSIAVSVYGVRQIKEHPETFEDNRSLYYFAISMIVLGAICCLGVIIWVTTDLLITWKKPENAIDEQGHYSKYKIKKYKNNFSPGKLPTLSKDKLNQSQGYFAEDLKYTKEYLQQISQNKQKNKNVMEQIANKVTQRQEKNKSKKKKHK